MIIKKVSFNRLNPSGQVIFKKNFNYIEDLWPSLNWRVRAVRAYSNFCRAFFALAANRTALESRRAWRACFRSLFFCLRASLSP